ncbi:hypothetical protein GCM10007148_05880 [Parvularcula lutaonensis]|nr:hypothetical protein GCM10007148_05880 [Parvularcula lutaonensis]
MNQYDVGFFARERFEAAQDRSLSLGASRHRWSDLGQAAGGIGKAVFLSLGYHGKDRRDPWVIRKCAEGPSQDRFSDDAPVLFGKLATCPDTLACSDDNNGNFHGPALAETGQGG